MSEAERGEGGREGPPARLLRDLWSMAMCWRQRQCYSSSGESRESRERRAHRAADADHVQLVVDLLADGLVVYVLVCPVRPALADDRAHVLGEENHRSLPRIVELKGRYEMIAPANFWDETTYESETWRRVDAYDVHATGLYYLKYVSACSVG
jgi:hypothetical protein